LKERHGIFFPLTNAVISLVECSSLTNSRPLARQVRRTSFLLCFLCWLPRDIAALTKKIHFSFDLNEFFAGHATNYFKLVKEMNLKHADRFGDLFFPESRNAPGVQAADLLAYQTNLYAKQRIGAIGKAPKGYALQRALKNIRSLEDFKLFDKHGLDIVLASFRQSQVSINRS
jgi:hypothetical protein